MHSKLSVPICEICVYFFIAIYIPIAIEIAITSYKTVI